MTIKLIVEKSHTCDNQNNDRIFATLSRNCPWQRHSGPGGNLIPTIRKAKNVRIYCSATHAHCLPENCALYAWRR